MASLYKRANSPFWWIKYRARNKVVRVSTGLKVCSPMDTANARALRAEFTLKELKVSAATKDRQQWHAWVDDFFEIHYANSPETQARYRRIWEKCLWPFLSERKVLTPVQLTRADCHAYFKWRRTLKTRSRETHTNTIRMEIKVLSAICSEALQRGYLQFNPCHRLGIEAVKVRPKPALTDAEITTIRQAIANNENFRHMKIHDWQHIFHVSFELALHQGCRISETWLDVNRDVDIENLLIRFKAKGGDYFETELHPNLVPLFQKLRGQNRATTYDRPAQRTLLSLHWKRFLQKLNLGHLSFHCLRVTVISRMGEQGAPEAVTMQKVHHASSTVHRVYRRISPAERQRHWPNLPPPPSLDTTCSQQTPDAPPANPSRTPELTDDHGTAPNPRASSR